MKKIFLTLIVGLSALSAFAQEPQQEVDLKQRYFDAKIHEFVYLLNLTDQQRDAFIPVYKRYDDEMHAASADKKRRGPRPATSEEAAAFVKDRIASQQAAQAIRLKYVDEFAAVLAPEQLCRLYDVEGQIQHKLKARKNEGKPGQGPMPGGRPGKGPRPADRPGPAPKPAPVAK